MRYITKGNVNPQGKPKVYFTGHPKDCELYFERIKHDIFKMHDCAIFYDENPEQPDDPDNFISDLDNMQLIVIVVTSRYVYNKKVFAHDVVFKHAMEKHIPVLPILEEIGIEREFNLKCGDIQFLNPNTTDSTEISFDEKLKKFLGSVLVEDELAKKIRAAFDAYVFLSYRKKDRRYAQELMRLIHSNSFCRDIAIWYDEFLVPGENFNDSIAEAMEKSELFAMVVTPSLLEKPNYVMSTEYPAAKDAGKKILPAVLVPTKERKLKKYYKDIPQPIDSGDIKSLAAALSNAFENIAVLENDGDPMHTFFIGLAYLSGIDVEIDHEQAVQMITEAAENELPEAIDKLVMMYRNGEGVARNYDTSVKWFRKLAEVRGREYYSEPNEDTGLVWIGTLWALGDFISELGQHGKALEVYKRFLSVSQDLYRIYKAEWIESAIGTAYLKLGNAYKALGNLSETEEYYEKGLEICKRLVEDGSELAQNDLITIYDSLGDFYLSQGEKMRAHIYFSDSLEIKERFAEDNESVESLIALSVSYSKLGDVCRQTPLLSRLWENDLEGALEYYNKSYNINKRLSEQNDDLRVRGNLFDDYYKIADVFTEQGKLSEAKEYYEKCLDISLLLAEQADSIWSQESLMISYQRLGSICKMLGEHSEAMEYYEKNFAVATYLAEYTDSATAKRNLYASYKNLAELNIDIGNISQATEYFKKAFEISQWLAEKQPNYARPQTDLCNIYVSLGDVYKIQGNFSKARECYEKSLDIKIHMLDEFDILIEPDKHDAYVYDKLGDVYKALGDFATARSYYKGSADAQESSLSTLKRFSKGAVDTTEREKNLSESYKKLGDVCKSLKEVQVAREYYEKAFELMNNLADKTNSADIHMELSSLCFKLADICKKHGDLQAVEEYYKKKITICEHFPEHTVTIEAQRELAVSHERLGNIYQNRKDMATAKSCYEKGFPIFESLAAHTGSEMDQNNLGIICKKLGDISMECKDLSAARKYYEIRLKIKESQASLKNSVDAQKELAEGYYNLGNICKDLKDSSAAMGYFDALIKARKYITEKKNTDKAYDDLAKAYLFRGGADPIFKNALSYIQQAESIWAMLARQFPNHTEYAEMQAKMQSILS